MELCEEERERLTHIGHSLQVNEGELEDVSGKT